MNVPEVCQQCKLYQQGCTTHLMSGQGSDHPDIIFIGEAPGRDEDERGTPFVGASGKLLRGTVEGLGIENARYTNVVRCRPPDNRTPTPKEIAYCSDFLVDELAQHSPKVVVMLGNTPLKAVLGYNGISSFQGQIIIQDGVRYVPLYHPAYALRGGSVAIDEWQASFSSVIDALHSNGEYKAADVHYQYLYPMELDELGTMRDELLSKPDDLVACDIESINLDVAYPDNKIISIALANSKKAWSFPIHHKDSWWSEAECQYIIEDVLTPILTQCRIINHNIKFDCKMIRHFLGIDFVPYGDTIQLSRLVNPQALEHGLKRLAGVHLQMFDYDEELRQYVAEHPECDYGRGGNYGNVPLDVLLPYGGKDVSATVLLHNELHPQLTEKQRTLYDQMIIKADYAIGQIEENGFKLDYWIINRYLNVYKAIMEHVYMPKINNDPDVQLYLDAKDMYDRLKSAKILTERKDGKIIKCEIDWPDGTKRRCDKNDWQSVYVDYQDELQAIDVPQSKRKPEFNPGSSHQIWPVLFTHKGLKPASGEIVKTDSGTPSTKRDVLKEIVYDLEKPNQFLSDYMDWKLLFSISNKTFKSMLDPNKDWYSADGRVRSTYTIGGAKTGRTSSTQPNLQNIPAIEKEPGTVLQYLPAKNCFTHTFPGGGLAMIDYSGMELRVMSSIAGITGMIDVFNRAGDVHRYVSSLIYKIPEEEITKFQRYRGKWCNWSLLYMGGWWTLYRLYRINGLTEAEAKRVATLYYDVFPQLPEYHKDVEKFLKEHGYVESAFGRKLSLPGFTSEKEYERSDALRTAVNFPIQGLASDVLMVALGITAQLMRGKGYQSMFVNTVHDSLVIDYHPDERDEIVKLTTDVMENVVDYAAEYMPGLDFTWLQVPLKADVDYGTHYGSYGFYQPPVCQCGGLLSYVADLGDTLDYHCHSCGVDTELKFKPLLLNNTHPDRLSVSSHLDEFILTNNYNGLRKPRKAN